MVIWVRILLYNWVQFDDSRLRGGGVSIYLRSIIPELINRGHEVYFISSGQHYTLTKTGPRLVATDNIFKDKVRSFRILNSPIKAPAHDAFFSVFESRESKELVKIFSSFIKKYKIDVFNAQNLEGLTMDVFELKSIFPDVKFILTAHNYHLVCPQIELFKDRKCNCFDFRGGWDCPDCLCHSSDMYDLIEYQRAGSFVELHNLDGRKMGNFLFDTLVGMYRFRQFLFNTKTVICKLLSEKPVKYDTLSKKYRYVAISKKKNSCADISNVNISSDFYYWRTDNVYLANHSMDAVIAVSSLVKDVLINYGVEESKVHVVLDGSDYATDLETARERWNSKKPGRLKIGYFGYPIPSKGLSLFLAAISEIGADLLNEIDVMIVSRIYEEHIMPIESLKPRCHNLTVVEGYHRQDISSLASSVSIGVIPSVWRETFCQTAAELICFGCPVLISSTTGIKDLYSDDRFIFESGNKQSLKEKLTNLITSPSVLDSFWNQICMPCTIGECVTGLEDVYREGE